MPFTLCHPALIVPLNRSARGLTSLSALVIGSMAPDFVYFLPLGIGGSFSHSLLGVLLFCVPAGALIYLLYVVLLREAFIAWAPQAIAARMHPQVNWPVRDSRAAAVVLVSLLIGAASHIGWDAFTHANTVVVNYFDVLRAPVSISGHVIPLYKVLQHLSSLLGSVVIATYVAHWFSVTEPVCPAGRQLSVRQRLFVFAAVSAAAAAGGAAGLLLRPASGIERALFNVVVSGMAATALAIVFLCIGWRVATARR